MGVSLFSEPNRPHDDPLGEFGTHVSWDTGGPVTESLRPWVLGVQAFAMSAARPRVFARLPESATSLVVSAREDGSFHVAVVGPRLRAFYKSATRVPGHAAFTFRPGAARAFLDVPLHELSDRAVPLEELWGSPALSLRVAIERARGSLRATTRAVESALVERLEKARAIGARTQLVVRAARALEASADDIEAIPAVAKRVGVSERHLRQLFRDEVGVSPKRFARIARIRRAVANVGRVGWAALAVDNGFYDQAHLNAEFRDLLGTTPREFAAGKVAVSIESCGR